MSRRKDLDGCEYDDGISEDRASVPIVAAVALGITMLWMVYSIGLCETRGYCGIGATARWVFDSLKGK